MGFLLVQKKSATTGNTKYITLVGIEKLNMLAYKNNPEPTPNPSLGMTSKIEVLNVLLKWEEMQGLIDLYISSSCLVTYPTLCFFFNKFNVIRSESYLRGYLIL